MKSLVYGALLGFFLLQTGQTPEDYPGQREHREPPKGWYCSASAKDKAHRCQCKRMMKATPDDPCCEGQEAPESPQCKVWCHKDRCLCPVQCETGGHHGA